jgi:malonyl-CoA O-methyltransferase
MMTKYKEISKCFDRHASEYEMAAVVQKEIGARLFERLSYLIHKPKRILDLGCGSGHFMHQLATLYPEAHVVGLDIAPKMLHAAEQACVLSQNTHWVNANMDHLPFADGTFDLVFANQAIHWASSLPQVFRELSRVMAVDACLMFTTLGPDSLYELKTAWSFVHDAAHVNAFPDMHDVGDCLMAERFLEPVMDMEYLSVHYDSLQQLMHALKAQGVRNVNEKRSIGLTSRVAFRQFEAQFETLRTEHGKFPLTYEVVYGHAWKGGQLRTEQGIETMIPVARLFQRPR